MNKFNIKFLKKRNFNPFVLFIFNIDIIKCINNSPNIATIPFDIGIPVSVIGIVAKSAIIIDIASSNGCICPISLFPINLITISTNMYNTIALKNVINIVFLLFVKNINFIFRIF